jgi:hypothetical protein
MSAVQVGVVRSDETRVVRKPQSYTTGAEAF